MQRQEGIHEPDQLKKQEVDQEHRHPASSASQSSASASSQSPAPEPTTPGSHKRPRELSTPSSDGPQSPHARTEEFPRAEGYPDIPSDSDLDSDPPDLDIEEGLYLGELIFGAFPRPPTQDAYYSLINESGHYLPTQAGALFPPPCGIM